MTLDQEIRARLINVETKINLLLNDERALSSTEGRTWSGNPDQVFGHLTYAQHGEDIIIACLFHKLGIARPSYLDVGAHHPLNISNTALLYSRGSRGINIEANPDLIPAFKKYRPEDKNLNIGVASREGTLPFYRIDNFSGRNSFDLKSVQDFIAAYPQFKINSAIEVKVTTLNAIVSKYNGGIFPNFLSIDVEGLDFEILSTTDFTNSKPQLLCVEVVSGSNTNQSAEMVGMLRDKGFEPIFSTAGNVIFADSKITKAVTSLY